MQYRIVVHLPWRSFYGSPTELSDSEVKLTRETLEQPSSHLGFATGKGYFHFPKQVLDQAVIEIECMEK